MTKNNREKNYIIEYVLLGNTVKVTAFDPASLREASIVGSPKATRGSLAKLAVRKLEYAIRKARKGKP